MARRSGRPLRLVVDTNIFISFLIGKQLKALQSGITERGFQFMIGEALLEEITEVASRPYLKKYFNASAVEFLVDGLTRHAMHVTLPKVIPAISRDPDDDYLLALAKVGKADMLITWRQGPASVGEVWPHTHPERPRLRGGIPAEEVIGARKWHP